MINLFEKNVYDPLFIREEFRFIPGVDNRYAISNFGRVYSYLSNMYMKPRLDNMGKYLIIDLRTSTGRKTYLLHRLVLLTFDPINGSDQLQVNHKNGITNDPFLYNLEWATQSMNQIHARFNNLFNCNGEDSANATLTNLQVEAICELLEDGRDSKYICNQLGMTHNYHMMGIICSIKNRRSWRTVSNRYNFKLSDKSNNLNTFTDGQVRSICSLLEKNIPYDGILNSLGYYASEIGETKFKSLRAVISSIRIKRRYANISSRYDINTTGRQIFTDDQIHDICRYLEFKMSYSEILTRIGYNRSELSQVEYKRLLDSISGIKTRKNFTNISDKYGF